MKRAVKLRWWFGRFLSNHFPIESSSCSSYWERTPRRRNLWIAWKIPSSRWESSSISEITNRTNIPSARHRLKDYSKQNSIGMSCAFKFNSPQNAQSDASVRITAGKSLITTFPMTGLSDLQLTHRPNIEDGGGVVHGGEDETIAVRPEHNTEG